MIITDTNIFINQIEDNIAEADGIYVDEGMITEDSKKKKKTNNLIRS
ncbi:MAG: hypothetical protein J1F35_05790 [Erysipelotrichales bacterium]|nr:hypothetical protein [Erysipelotrichales bacterium]